MITTKEDVVNIALSKDEALVLFDFVWRFSQEDKLTIEDQAEERALWNLCCYFEKQLPEPFGNNFESLMQQAKDNLRDSTE